MSTIARYYDQDKNPEDVRFIAGIPLRDVTEDEWEQLPKHLQRSADASDLYRKTKPPQKDEET